MMRITLKMRSSRSGLAVAKAGWPLFLLVGLIPVVCLAQSTAGDGTVGVPWNGGPGATETVAAIMARDKNLPVQSGMKPRQDRKSTRLNSSHPSISYAVFCLKKKKTKNLIHLQIKQTKKIIQQI